MKLISAWGSAPNALPREKKPHVCGKCRNPWTVGNPACPNAPKERS